MFGGTTFFGDDAAGVVGNRHHRDQRLIFAFFFPKILWHAIMRLTPARDGVQTLLPFSHCSNCRLK